MSVHVSVRASVRAVFVQSISPILLEKAILNLAQKRRYLYWFITLTVTPTYVVSKQRSAMHVGYIHVFVNISSGTYSY